jgi:hypothetical protein
MRPGGIADALRLAQVRLPPLQCIEGLGMDSLDRLILPVWICGKLSRELDRMLCSHRIASGSSCQSIPKLGSYICFAEFRIRQQSGCSAVDGLKATHGQFKLALLDFLFFLLIFQQPILKFKRVRVPSLFIDRGIDRAALAH